MRRQKAVGQEERGPPVRGVQSPGGFFFWGFLRGPERAEKPASGGKSVQKLRESLGHKQTS